MALIFNTESRKLKTAFLYFGTISVIRLIKLRIMDRACSTYRAKRNAQRILVGKPEGK
jgi:hypothetical protein